MNMNMKNKKHLAIAVSIACTVGLSTTTAQAIDFTATATVDNAITLTVVNNIDLGSLFATVTGAALTNGVGALIIAPDGTVTDPADSATVNLVNLGTPVPGQGSVAMAASFTLTFPDTSTYALADFDDGNGGALAAALGVTTELTHSSADPSVPSLYLTHYTVGDVSGGTAVEANTNDGDFTVTPGFAATTYVFNIGATVTTEPTAALATYQPGVYSGIVAVTASY